MEVYRCGWCGIPTNKNGEPLGGFGRETVIQIIEMNMGHVEIKVNGQCCRHEGNNE